MQRRIAMVAAGFAVLIAGAIVAYLALSNARSSALPPGALNVPFTPAEFRTEYTYQTEGKSLDELSDERRADELRDQEWRATASFMELDADTATIVDAWAPSVLDPTHVLDEQARNVFLRLLARHALSRAQDTPDAYVTLIEESESSQWNADIANDFQLAAFYNFFAARTMDASMDDRAILRDVWGEFKLRDHLFEAVGVGEKGAVFLAKRIRLPAQANLGLSGKYAIDNEPDYWTSVGYRYGIRFSEANRTLESVLMENPSVLMMYAHVLVRLRDGRIANWMSRWFLDPNTGAWTLDMMQMSSSKNAFLIW